MNLKKLLCGCAIIATSHHAVASSDALDRPDTAQNLHTTTPQENALSPRDDEGMDNQAQSFAVNSTSHAANIKTTIDALQSLATYFGDDISQALTAFLLNTSDTENQNKLLNLLSSFPVSEDTSEADKEKISQFHALLAQINIKEPSNEEETPQRQPSNEGSSSDDSSDQQDGKENTSEGSYSDAEQGEEEEETDEQNQSVHDEEEQEKN